MEFDRPPLCQVVTGSVIANDALLDSSPQTVQVHIICGSVEGRTTLGNERVVNLFHFATPIRASATRPHSA